MGQYESRELSFQLRVRLSTRISQKAHVQTSPNFLYMLHVAEARSWCMVARLMAEGSVGLREAVQRGESLLFLMPFFICNTCKERVM